MLNSLLLPSAYFGPISYYAFMIKTRTPIIEKNNSYIKQTIRNRCYIYGSNGKLRLTVPKKRNTIEKQPMNEIKICYAEKWQKKHWKAILSSYNSSPYFKYYENDLHHIFQQKEKYLIELNAKINSIILKILDHNIKTIKTNYNYKQKSNIDLRNHNWDQDIIKQYDQVFMEKHGFITNLSILDLIFNLGPESKTFLQKI